MVGFNKIVIATDKFKGSMTALQAAEAVKDGLSEGFAGTDIRQPDILLCPMADGGEGSMGVMERVLRDKSADYSKIFIDSVNHLGEPILAPVLIYESNGRKTAFIEMASVCGLNMIRKSHRNILKSTTYGLGSTMRSVITDHGVRKILMAIGGSGTNDGGFGMLTALGWSFSNSNPFRNKDIPTFLSGIESISDRSVGNVCPHLKDTTIEIACDVTSPLLGPEGATATYGPQKGCSQKDIGRFEDALANWQKVIGYPDFPGAGAAGGTGYALKAVLGADMEPGWKLFASMLDLEKEIASADLVITGEGRFDRSSLTGKLPAGIASLCRQYGKPLWVITGRNLIPENAYRPMGINRMIEITAMANEGEDPVRCAQDIIRRSISQIIKQEK